LTIVPDRRISHLDLCRMLLSGLDLNRCVKGGHVSNSSLDFKQCSFTHIIRSWDDDAGKRFPSSSLFRRAIFPFRFPFSVNRMTSQVFFLTCDTLRTIIRAVVRRTRPVSMSGCERWWRNIRGAARSLVAGKRRVGYNLIWRGGFDRIARN